MRLTDEQFKQLLIGNYIGYKRGDGGNVPSDPNERLAGSKGLRGAHMVIVEGKTKQEAALATGVTRQAVGRLVDRLCEEYYNKEGSIELKVRIPSDKQDALAKFLFKIGGEEI